MTNIFEIINNDLIINGPYILRLLLASVCGAFIGFERGRRQKDAGIRTHVIVALGAALIVLVSKYGFLDIVYLDSVQVDVSRVASTIVSGVSFLGAGMIFIKDISIKGLTTAAGIWTTAAVGMAAGSGLYTLAIVATIMIIVFQVLLHKYMSGLENKVDEVLIVMNDNEKALETFKTHFETKRISVNSTKFKRNKRDNTIEIFTSIKRPASLSMEDIVNDLCNDKDIISIEY